MNFGFLADKITYYYTQKFLMTHFAFKCNDFRKVTIAWKE